jgi:hypothetical protein
MTPLPRFVSRLLVLSAFALALAPLQMSAITIPVQYTFTGVCQDCSGTGVGVLTLQDYTPGATITTKSDNFVSFTYLSNLTSFSVTGAQLVYIFGALPLAPGPGELFLQDSSFDVFNSTVTGSWCVGGIGSPCGNDQGATSVWDSALAPVPEPATILPMAVVLIGLGLLLKRRRSLI